MCLDLPIKLRICDKIKIIVYKRKIYDEFLEWKKNWTGRRALLVQGARRIGKSTIVEEFAKREYKSYILINFQSDRNKVEKLFDDIFFLTISLESYCLFMM